MRSLKHRGNIIPPGRFRFKEPDSTKAYSTLKDVVVAVVQYRQANQIAFESVDAVRAEVEDWICHNIGSPEYYCKEDGQAMPMPDHTGLAHATGYQGATKWEELHEWALTLDGTTTPESRIAWMDRFSSSLPCGECRRSWRKYVKANPPPYDGDAEAMWRWSFESHQSVRRKLNQPLITEEEARAVYDTEPSPETEGEQP